MRGLVFEKHVQGTQSQHPESSRLYAPGDPDFPGGFSAGPIAHTGNQWHGEGGVRIPVPEWFLARR